MCVLYYVCEKSGYSYLQLINLIYFYMYILKKNNNKQLSEFVLFVQICVFLFIFNLKRPQWENVGTGT